MIKYYHRIIGLFICGLLIVLMSANIVKGDQSTKGGNSKMIAVYAVDRWIKNLKGQSTADIVKFLEQHKINAVFGGYDNTAFRDECRKNEIKVYADLLCFQGEKHWQSHPESHPIGLDGKPIEKEEWYCGVCPNQKWLQDELLKKAKKLVDEYKVDGVWLDFIRYPCHWEVKEPKLYQSCFCDVCLGLFKREKQIEIPDSLSRDKAAEYIMEKHSDKWSEWKCEKIAGFVKEISDQIKKENPEIVLGLFGVPWQTDEFDNAIIEIVGQDFKLLADSGVDIFSPMVYHKLCYRNVEWIKQSTSYFKKITGKDIVPIIQACSIPDKLSDDEFKQSIKIALNPPSSGVIIFHSNYLEKENKWSALKQALND